MCILMMIKQFESAANWSIIDQFPESFEILIENWFKIDRILGRIILDSLKWIYVLRRINQSQNKIGKTSWRNKSPFWIDKICGRIISDSLKWIYVLRRINHSQNKIGKNMFANYFFMNLILRSELFITSNNNLNKTYQTLDWSLPSLLQPTRIPISIPPTLIPNRFHFGQFELRNGFTLTNLESELISIWPTWILNWFYFSQLRFQFHFGQLWFRIDFTSANSDSE